MSKVLVTGGAGFIGYYFTKKLLENNFEVVSIDNLDDFYDINLKLDRLRLLGIETSEIAYGNPLISKKNNRLTFIKGDILDTELLSEITNETDIDYIAHFAARSGVRDSFDNYDVYIENNIRGTANILNIAAKMKIKNFLYTSSSSVVGNYNENDDSEDENPHSLYGTSKKAAEILAKTYSSKYRLPVTIARLFSVYGYMGRADGLILSSIDKIKKNQTLELNNNGNMWRDFIYIDDAIEILFRLMLSAPKEGYDLYEVGTGIPTRITDAIAMIEKNLGMKANVKYKNSHLGENVFSVADIEYLKKATGISGLVSFEKGIEKLLSVY